MRLLVVGHPFILAFNQQKYAAMKRLDLQLELRILGPKEYRHPFGKFLPEVHPDLSSAEVVPLPFFLYGTHMTYLLDPLGVARILREFRPDVIHLEEEPHAFITAEMTSLREAFAPQAALTLFTWDNLDRPRRFPISTLKRRLRAFSLRRASAVVCGNRDAQRILRAQAGYERPAPVLPQYGLDPEKHAPGPEPLLKQRLGLDDAVCVAYAGRMLPEKGVRLLWEALTRLTRFPWKLLLVGSGPLDTEIDVQWSARFPRRVVRVPAVPHHQVPRYLRCADIFVLASYAVENWKEQFGLALAQAMMVGAAPVGSSSGAIPGVLGPGGLVFEEGNIGSLAHALESLFVSPQLRQELGAQARSFALANYSLPRVAEKYLSVFEQAQRACVSAQRVPGRALARLDRL